MCGPMVHVPFGGSTEGASQSSCPARHQGDSSSVAVLLVAERIVCAVVAAPTATPASVRVDARCPAPPVDYRAGLVGGMKHGLELGDYALLFLAVRKTSC